MISTQETCNAGGMFSRWAECERVLEADDDELELEELELEDELESVRIFNAVSIWIEIGSITFIGFT